ncbi:hypothetical protein [Sphingomonas humi]|uniref:Uncharacterized protein n=1 Tax=Sphingomonas humi TaxID=335630 RepID=A0ABP7S240_9SPHN
MAASLIAGFSLQLAAGRSSFSAPLLVHAHAVVFMGWIAIYVLQNGLVAANQVALHRKLGWIAVGWVFAMLATATAVTLAMVREGRVPFFFQPQQFLIFDPLSLIMFAGLTFWAVKLRRQTDWHRRLHFCAMSLLLGPGFGRLLPMPLLQPYAFEATAVPVMAFPVVAMLLDRRRKGYVHPAWWWGLGTIVAYFLLTEGITHSPIGDALYHATVAGSPAAGIDGMAFGAPPPGL